MAWLRTAILGIVIVLWLTPVVLAADQTPSPDAITGKLMDKLDLRAYEEYKQHIDDDLQGGFTDLSPTEWIRAFMRGEFKFDLKKTGESLLRYLVKEVASSSHLMAKLLILAVISALLINLQTSFASESVAKISSLVCYLALAAIALGSFKSMLQLGLSTVTSLADFMTASLPQLAIIMTGMGNVNSATLLFPLLAGASSFFANLVQTVIFPLITISAVLHLINCLSDTIKVKNLAGLVKTLSLFILGLVMTLFVGALTMRAVYGNVLDGLALKTTQMVADNFPVIGGFLSEALGVAAGYLVLLKQAVGVLGILLILGVCVFPVLKMLAVVIVYKVAAAMAEPMGDSRTSEVLAVIGDHLTLLMGVVAAVGLMFIIMVSIIAGVSNHVVMLR